MTFIQVVMLTLMSAACASESLMRNEKHARLTPDALVEIESDGSVVTKEVKMDYPTKPEHMNDEKWKEFLSFLDVHRANKTFHKGTQKDRHASSKPACADVQYSVSCPAMRRDWWFFCPEMFAWGFECFHLCCVTHARESPADKCSTCEDPNAPRAKCNTFSCPANMVNTGHECTGSDSGSCTQARCCGPLPTCDTFSCSGATPVNKGGDVECTSSTCDAATCCEASATCDLMEKACPPATPMQKGDAVKCTGKKDSCTTQLCCEAATTFEIVSGSGCVTTQGGTCIENKKSGHSYAQGAAGSCEFMTPSQGTMKTEKYSTLWDYDYIQIGNQKYNKKCAKCTSGEAAYFNNKPPPATRALSSRTVVKFVSSTYEKHGRGVQAVTGWKFCVR